jgi:hypothetical protein
MGDFLKTRRLSASQEELSSMKLIVNMGTSSHRHWLEILSGNVSKECRSSGGISNYN